MAEQDRLTKPFDGITGGFEEIDAAAEHTAETVLHFNQKLISSYEVLEESQRVFAERIKETGNEVSTFKNSQNLIDKQPLPLPLGPLPAENEEFFREVRQFSADSLEFFKKVLGFVKLLEPFIRFYQANAPIINTIVATITLSILGIFAAITSPIWAASIGSILVLLTALATAFFVINGGVEQLGKISDIVFKKLKSDVFLTEEEAQKEAERLRKAVESYRNSVPEFPPVEQKLILSPELPPEQQEEFLKENERLLDEDVGGLLEEKSSEFGKATSEGILNGIQVAFAGGLDFLGGLFPEAQAAELADNIEQTVENVEVPEIPLDLKLDLNELEQALPQELLDRLNAAEVITPELDREIQEAARKYLELTGQIKKGTEAQSEFSEAGGNTAETLQKVEENAGAAADNTGDFTERTGKASDTLDGLGDLATSFSGNIENAFSNTLTSALSGDFDGIKDIWKRTLDSMFSIFTDFAADVISKPIKVFFDQVFNDSTSSKSTPGTEGAQAGENAEGSQLNTGEKVGVGLIIGGAALSSIASNIENEVASNIVGGIGQTASFAGAGLALTGGNPIGAIIGAVVGLITSLVNILSDALKKKPRLDIELDTFRDEFGRSTGEAAKVMDFLDEDVFNNEIFNRSVSRQAGLGLGGGLGETVREAIAGQILEIQDIIFRLPADLAADLNDALLNTTVDIESEVQGDRLLEFDETKNIAQKFQQFIEGDVQARYVQAIRGFFADSFVALGALPDAAQKFIDEQFEEFQGLSREERIEFGEDFINDFGAVVDAFNIINGNAPDSINGTINSLKNLSDTLGFDAIPSIDELDSSLEEMISAAEFDPSVIADMIELRNAILQLQTAILSSIQSIIGNIQQLNSIIVDAGGSAFDLTGFITEGLDKTIGLLGQEGLSVEDREALLSQGQGFLNQMIAEEQAAFNQAQQAAQRAAEARADAQRRAVQSQIDGLEREKDLIDRNFDARLEALQEELQIAQEFEQLTESIRNTLESIIFSSESVLTPIEQVGLAQSDITRLQGELAGTSDTERQAEIAGQLEEAFDRLFGLSADAFGVNSPEFVAIFDQVTGGLESLAEFTEGRTRSVEEINAEIEALNEQRNQLLEAIDARIDAAQERLSSIQTQNVEATFQASAAVREYAEFFRSEYIKILEERFEQSDEITAEGFTEEIDALNSIVDFSAAIKDLEDQGVQLADDQLVVLRDLLAEFRNVPGFRTGSGGIRDFGAGLLARLHGREGVFTVDQINDIARSGAIHAANQLSSPAALVSGFVEALSRRQVMAQLQETLSFASTTRSLSDALSQRTREFAENEFRSRRTGDFSEAFGEMNVNLSVNVNGGSNAAVQTVSTEIENMLVRSIRQGGRLRSAIQEAGARRIN